MHNLHTYVRRMFVLASLTMAIVVSLCPAMASAKTSSCARLYSGLVTLHVANTTCKVGKDVAKWNDGHELGFTNNARIDGHRWHGTLFSCAHGHTYFRYTSGNETVWITYLQEVG